MLVTVTAEVPRTVKSFKTILKAHLGDMILGASNDHHLSSKFRGAPGQAVVPFLVLAWSIAHWERVDHGPVD